MKLLEDISEYSEVFGQGRYKGRYNLEKKHNFIEFGYKNVYKVNKINFICDIKTGKRNPDNSDRD